MQFIQLIPDFKKTFIKKIYLSGLNWSDLYQHFDIFGTLAVRCSHEFGVVYLSQEERMSFLKNQTTASVVNTMNYFVQVSLNDVWVEICFHVQRL